MSNSLAIPAVTASIVAILQARMNAAGLASTPAVAAGSIDSGTAPCVAVHLYRIERNGYRDNEQLLTRTADGQLRQRPRAALDLHYMLAFRGTHALETDRIIAIAAAGLAATPDLSRQLVSTVGTTYPLADGNDLAEADELVRVTPEQLSVDELTRLWALYSPDSFTTTLGYVAGPVVVDADDTPGTVLPAAGFAIGARPLSAPRIDSIAGPDGPGAPIRAAALAPTIQVLGASLGPRPTEQLVVLVDGVALPPVSVVNDGELTFPLASQAPGVHSLQVRRLSDPIDPSLSLTRPAVSSQVVTFVVLPSLDAASAPGTTHAGGQSAGTFVVDVQPPLSSTNRVRLLLDSQTLNPPVAVAVPFTVAVGPPVATLHIPFSHVPTDSYRITLEVDGVRSVPKFDSSHHYVVLVVSL